MPQFGADGLLIGPPLIAVMGVFTGPDSSTGAGDLRSTPAGRALVAQGKSLGWDDAIGELRKGQGLHRALAGTLSTRKPNYEETTDDHA